MEFPGFSLQGEEKDEARLRKHDLKLCVCLTRRVQSVSSSDISIMISTIPQTPRSLPPGVLSTTRRPLYHPASSLPPRVLSTTPRPLYHPASSLPPRVLSTTPRPLYNPASSLQPRVLHHPPRYKATLPIHTCSERLCFGYVYPAPTLSVCIRLTWG
jgi:hypothetical protein